MLVQCAKAVICPATSKKQVIVAASSGQPCSRLKIAQKTLQVLCFVNYCNQGVIHKSTIQSRLRVTTKDDASWASKTKTSLDALFNVCNPLGS